MSMSMHAKQSQSYLRVDSTHRPSYSASAVAALDSYSLTLSDEDYQLMLEVADREDLLLPNSFYDDDSNEPI